jgi:hypothetical protein
MSMYMILGNLISQTSDLKIAIIINCSLALFDSIFGFLLSINFEANSGFTKEQSLKMIGPKTSISVMVFALLFTLIGYGMTFL